jgi:hypothetical protein
MKRCSNSADRSEGRRSRGSDSSARRPTSGTEPWWRPEGRCPKSGSAFENGYRATRRRLRQVRWKKQLTREGGRTCSARPTPCRGNQANNRATAIEHLIFLNQCLMLRFLHHTTLLLYLLQAISSIPRAVASVGIPGEKPFLNGNS